MNVLGGFADILEQSSIDEAYLDCTNRVIHFNNNSNSSNRTRTTDAAL